MTEISGACSWLWTTVLRSREYRILVMRYGILGCKEHTQQEVGDVLGISRSYVSRMEKRALHKLAEALRED